MDYGHFILVDKKPVRVGLLEWGRFCEDAEKRRVAHHYLENGDGKISVSTVFLGIDHNFSDEGPPVLFETMIFGGNLNEYQFRYCTYEEAEKGHKDAIKMIFDDALENRDWKLVDTIREKFPDITEENKQ